VKQGSPGKALKRRGILAAAGAVVAGIAATRASREVGATAGTGTDGNLVLGSNSTNNTANYTSLRTEVISGLTFHGAVLLDCSASPFQSSGDPNAIGISGTSRGSAAGVYGSDSVGSKPSGYPANMNAGVYGYTSAQGHSGVRGDGGTYGIGVSGVSTNSNAILGTTLGSPYNTNAAVLGLGYAVGVEGDITAGSSVTNSVAVKGINQSTWAGSFGVYGSTAHGFAGVYGLAGAKQGSGGVVGVATQAGTVGFAAAAYAPAVDAGYFTGNVSVFGNFGVSGSKFAVVKGGTGSTGGCTRWSRPNAGSRTSAPARWSMGRRRSNSIRSSHSTSTPTTTMSSSPSTAITTSMWRSATGRGSRRR
jgi:hypothetical protein